MEVIKITGFPNPEKGFCPQCKTPELFVPVWLKYGNNGSEYLAWRCTRCGHQIEYKSS